MTACHHPPSAGDVRATAPASPHTRATHFPHHQHQHHSHSHPHNSSHGHQAHHYGNGPQQQQAGPSSAADMEQRYSAFEKYKRPGHEVHERAAMHPHHMPHPATSAMMGPVAGPAMMHFGPGQPFGQPHGMPPGLLGQAYVPRPHHMAGMPPQGLLGPAMGYQPPGMAAYDYQSLAALQAQHAMRAQQELHSEMFAASAAALPVAASSVTPAAVAAAAAAAAPANVANLAGEVVVVLLFLCCLPFARVCFSHDATLTGMYCCLVCTASCTHVQCPNSSTRHTL